MESLKIQTFRSSKDRPVNWYDRTIESLSMQLPEIQPICRQMTNRLMALLLERLPDRISQEILALLPKSAVDTCPEVLNSSANSPSEASISYLDFVQRVTTTLGCSNLNFFDTETTSEMELRATSEKIVDHFLWTIAQDFPSDLKHRISFHLPIDLRSRMNLYSSHSDDSKVA